MLGWQIIVYPEGGKSHFGSPDRVATWLTGWDGTEWLETMVKGGRAELLNHGGGYPCSYRMLWKDLLPELLEQPQPYQGPPVIGEDYVMEKGWQSIKEINREALARCLPDMVMRVDAWDQS